VMYMKDPEPEETFAGAGLPLPARVAVVASLLVVLVLGVWPQRLMDATQSGAQSFSGTSLEQVAGR